MPYTPYKKGTLLIPSGPRGNHLFAIVTDIGAQGDHLLVSISSIKAGQCYDDTSVIEAGEHRFIRHQSYAVYRLSEIQSAEKLSRMVDGWVYRPHDDISEDLLNRLRNGIEKSLFTPGRIIKYFGENN